MSCKFSRGFLNCEIDIVNFVNESCFIGVLKDLGEFSRIFFFCNVFLNFFVGGWDVVIMRSWGDVNFEIIVICEFFEVCFIGDG